MSSTVTTVYEWPEESRIKRIQSVRDMDGKYALHIFANESLPAGSMGELPRELRRYGFNDEYAGVEDGKNVLNIGKLKEKDVERVFDLLKNKEYVAGSPEVNRTEQKSASGFLSHVEENALKYSGKTGLLGHGALFLRGALRWDVPQMKQGPLGAMVPFILGACGNGQDAASLDPIIKEMADYFHKEGVPFPDVDPEHHRTSLLTSIKNYVSTHPTLVAGGIGTYAAWNGMRSGMADRNTFRTLAAGSSMAGTVAMMAVPEKPQDDDVSPLGKLKGSLVDLGKACLKPTTLPRAMVDFVQNGPIMFMGILNLVDNVLYGGALWKEWKTHKRMQSEVGLAEAKNLQSYYQRELDLMTRGHIEVKENLRNQIESTLDPSLDEAARKLEIDKRYEQLMRKFGQIGNNSEAQRFMGKLDGTRSQYAALESKALKKADALQSEISRIAKDAEMSTEKVFLNGRVTGGAIAAGLSAVTLLSWGLSSSLAAISSKNANQKQKDEYLDRLYSSMAKLMLEVEPEHRTTTLNLISNYLSANTHLHALRLTTGGLVDEIGKRMEVMQSSKWVDRMVAQSAQTQNMATAHV